jgi:hypothetical protein
MVAFLNAAIIRPLKPAPVSHFLPILFDCGLASSGMLVMFETEA